MEFQVNSITDGDVSGNIDTEAIRIGLTKLNQPKVFSRFSKVYVTAVCRKPNDFESELWQDKDSVYVTITLPHFVGLNKPTTEITKGYVKRYYELVQNVAEIPQLSSLEEEF